MALPIQIRHYDKVGDESFLFATWLKSYTIRGVPQPIYNIGQRNRIINILKDPTNHVLVASHPEIPELIFGWIVIGEANSLHYVYVKSQYRNSGVAKALLGMLSEEPIQFTHKPGAIWIERYLQNNPRFLYNPYLLEKR